MVAKRYGRLHLLRIPQALKNSHQPFGDILVLLNENQCSATTSFKDTSSQGDKVFWSFERSSIHNNSVDMGYWFSDQPTGTDRFRGYSSSVYILTFFAKDAWIKCLFSTMVQYYAICQLP